MMTRETIERLAAYSAYLDQTVKDGMEYGEGDLDHPGTVRAALEGITALASAGETLIALFGGEEPDEEWSKEDRNAWAYAVATIGAVSAQDPAGFHRVGDNDLPTWVQWAVAASGLAVERRCESEDGSGFAVLVRGPITAAAMGVLVRCPVFVEVRGQWLHFSDAARKPLGRVTRFCLRFDDRDRAEEAMCRARKATDRREAIVDMASVGRGEWDVLGTAESEGADLGTALAAAITPE